MRRDPCFKKFHALTLLGPPQTGLSAQLLCVQPARFGSLPAAAVTRGPTPRNGGCSTCRSPTDPAEETQRCFHLWTHQLLEINGLTSACSESFQAWHPLQFEGPVWQWEDRLWPDTGQAGCAGRADRLSPCLDCTATQLSDWNWGTEREDDSR